jgi:serine/threonine-protein kinase
VVPGFSEERELGGGASGRVVAAVHRASGTRVAIKYLSPRLLALPGFLDAFRSEAALLRTLNVPQVVRLFDYVEAPGQGAAIIMELVDGVSLHEMITRQGPTGAESALVVLKGSLRGLAAAHALGIVHRDYKPENVLVSRMGQSKLTDFGVAATTGQVASGGTPLYMSPEQWRGAPASPVTDIYAATAVFFECLTGQTPFSGGLGQLAAQHADARVPVEMVDEPLRELLARGMAKDPAARPANAAAFLAELETMAASSYGAGWEERGGRVLAERAAALLLLLLVNTGTTIGAGTGTAITSTVLPAKAAIGGLSIPQAAGLFAAVFAVVAGTVVGISAARGGPHRPPAPAAATTVLPRIAYATDTGLYTRTGTASPDELTSVPAGAQASQFTWSSDGRWLGWFSGPAGQAASQVHITDTRTRVTHTWPCASCTVGAFSGSSLLTSVPASSAAPALTAFPDNGGPAAPVPLSGPALSGSPEVIASTPGDSSVVFFAGDEVSGALYEATASGQVTLVYRLPFSAGPGGARDFGGVGEIGVSPDGTTVAYGCNYVGGDPGEGSDCVTIVNLATGATQYTTLPPDQTHPLRVSAVWIDAAGQVYAIAWHQPGAAGVNVSPAPVTPHEYRLDNGHWTDAGPQNVTAGGGRAGWIASLQGPASITVGVTPSSPQSPAQLVASVGGRRVTIASNVTTFAWAPS